MVNSPAVGKRYYYKPNANTVGKIVEIISRSSRNYFRVRHGFTTILISRHQLYELEG